jgi:UDP-N-acetylglucosamine:LPS N-acetylglucosamine transferase
MLPGQEVGNARYVVEHQAGAWAPGPVETLATVYEWLRDTPPQLETIQINAKQLGHPRAAYEIAEGIWGLAGATS